MIKGSEKRPLDFALVFRDTMTFERKHMIKNSLGGLFK